MTYNNILFVKKADSKESIEEIAVRCITRANTSGKAVYFTFDDVHVLVQPESLVKDIVYDWKKKKKALTDKNKKAHKIINKTGRDIILKSDGKVSILRAVEDPIKFFTYENNFQLIQSEEEDIWIYRSDAWFEQLPPVLPNVYYVIDSEAYHHIKIEYPDRRDFVFVKGEKKVGSRYLTGKHLSTELIY